MTMGRTKITARIRPAEDESPFSVTGYQMEALQLLTPQEQLTVSEWAAKYRMLDSKSSAMPGMWSNDVTPYLVGVMDEFNNYKTERIIFCKPTQIGGTEALQNMVGWIVMQDPSPAMIVYPTDVLGKSVVVNRLKPALMHTPEIAARFDEQSPAMELQFDGMYLSIAGSNSPSGLASKPIKYLLMDEVDKYPGASNREADPIKLALERTKTYRSNRKIYITSTPTLKTGHVWKEKESADIEKHYFVPCPHCGVYIELKMAQIKFPDDEGMSYADRAEVATYICQECGEPISDNEKHEMIKHGEWRAVRRDTRFERSVAFWINTLYSPFVRWADIAREFLSSKDDPEDLQNFVNSWLAEPWEETHLKTSVDLVMERQTEVEPYVVPGWAKLLTAGVDVQETSLYWTIRAWGDYLTSQNIAHGQALSFQEIDDVMNREYETEDGEVLIVNLCLVDSGDQTDMVYDFCSDHTDWSLPVKGASAPQLSHYKLSKINREGSSAHGMTLVMVDGGKYKDMIAGRMRKENGRGSWMVYNGCDEEYAKQVTAEHKVNVKRNGVVRQMWQPKTSHADNHYLDAEVYCMAAADILGVRTLHLKNIETEEEEKPAPREIETPETREEQWITANEGWLQGGYR